MERNAVCWWPVVDGLPSPLSTDVEEISIYMRLAHAVSEVKARGGSAARR
jgi:hypothetical protein